MNSQIIKEFRNELRDLSSSEILELVEQETNPSREWCKAIVLTLEERNESVPRALKSYIQRNENQGVSRGTKTFIFMVILIFLVLLFVRCQIVLTPVVETVQ